VDVAVPEPLAAAPRAAAPAVVRLGDPAAQDASAILRFSLADLQRVRPDAEPSWASINLAEGVSPEQVATSLTGRLSGLGCVEVQTTEGNDEIDAFRLAFLLKSILVIIVAVANLASTMLLAVRQRSHDLGLLRAVGVTPRQVVAIITAGAGVLAVAAAVIGIPLGLIISDAVAAVVGSASGIGPGIGAGPGVAAVLVLVLLTHRSRRDPRRRCRPPCGRGRGVGPGALRVTGRRCAI
jgi:putative ABC transport system permease protein